MKLRGYLLLWDRKAPEAYIMWYDEFPCYADFLSVSVDLEGKCRSETHMSSVIWVVSSNVVWLISNNPIALLNMQDALSYRVLCYDLPDPHFEVIIRVIVYATSFIPHWLWNAHLGWSHLKKKIWFPTFMPLECLTQSFCIFLHQTSLLLLSCLWCLETKLYWKLAKFLWSHSLVIWMSNLMLDAWICLLHVHLMYPLSLFGMLLWESAYHYIETWAM